jgi:hypothetical protein
MTMTGDTTTLYHFTNPVALKFLSDGRGPHSGEPWTIGEWVEAEGPLVPFHNGIHACTLGQAVRWVTPSAFVVELDGDIIDDGHQLVARRGRLVKRVGGWDDRTARLFAADCAENVLHIFEDACPGDLRPRRAIETARSVAAGRITPEGAEQARAEADAAAWDAPAPAPRLAAWSASRAAGRTSWVGFDDALDRTERAWQAGRLARYLDPEKGTP